jgi:hypothetical protein
MPKSRRDWPWLPGVIASEAKQSSLLAKAMEMDCFVASLLAMTAQAVITRHRVARMRAR